MEIKIDDIRSNMPKNPNPKRRYRTRHLRGIKKIVLHCDDMDKDIQEIADYDVTPNPEHHISPLGCPGCTYHFFIEKNGRILYCEDIRKITWHAGRHNGKAIAVCIRYKATDNPNMPPAEQLQGVYTLLTALCLGLKIDPDNILGHRELKGTGYFIRNGVKKLRKTCPGLLVNMNLIRTEVSNRVQVALLNIGLYHGAIDGIFGPKSEIALKKYQLPRKTRIF